MADAVDHPRHYNALGATCAKCGEPIECIDVVRHMNFNDGNAVKYVWRGPHKGKRLEDLRKAAWYINDEIKRLEAAGATDGD
jgi:hypothetical protein